MNHVFKQAFLRHKLRRSRSLSTLDAALEKRLWVFGIPGARASRHDHGVHLRGGVSWNTVVMIVLGGAFS